MTLIEHWDGTAWHLVPGVNVPLLHGVEQCVGVGFGTLHLQWDGRRWTTRGCL